jgi:glycosyltransferase involved in cell wall biosynthesis
MRVFVVMPVYNEGETVRNLVEDVARYVPERDIVIVDDGSTPKLEPAWVGGARLLRHRINLGKGMALKTGCEHALARGAEAIVLIDGDGQHEPAEIPRLLSALAGADIVFAARKLNRQMPAVRLAGNWVLNQSAGWLFRLDLKDIWCGFRAFRADVFDKIVWDAHDYAVDVEMAVRAFRHGLRSHEVPIGTVYHDAHKGVTVLDGLRLLCRLVGWRFTL